MFLAKTNDHIPSPLELLWLFYSFLFGMGPWYWIPILSCFSYTFAYWLVLHRAALGDARSRGGVEALSFVRIIFWERIAKRDIWAWIYFICIPMGPLLFFIGIFNTMKH